MVSNNPPTEEELLAEEATAEDAQTEEAATEETAQEETEAPETAETGDDDEASADLDDLLSEITEGPSDDTDEDEDAEEAAVDSNLPSADTRGTTVVTPGQVEAPAEEKEEVKTKDKKQPEADEQKTERVKKRKLRKRWYIIHTYSGHENKVKINLERRIDTMSMTDKIFRVEVPQKTVTKINDKGKRQEKDENIFPGYVLVEMIMDDDSWYVVRHTPGVTKFVGSQKKPIPAKDSEIKRILGRTTPLAEKVEIDLKVGENVKIISGPFADFEGTVTEVSPEKERLKANISIFGRETPVELSFNQIQKAQ